MRDRKRLSLYQRYRDRHGQPTSEEESLMRLLGLKSLEELYQWFKERENGLPPQDLLDLQDMHPPDQALDLAEKEAEEEEDEAERQEEIDQLRASRPARIEPQLLRRLHHLSANPKRDPEVYRIVVKIGMINFEAGWREYLEWSARMVHDIGERFRPLLRDVWLKMPSEVRSEGDRRLRQLGAEVKPEESRKIRERIRAFTEIEKKPMGLVDVTGKEVRLSDEARAKSLEPIIPPLSPGLKLQKAPDGVATPPSTKRAAGSLLGAPTGTRYERGQPTSKESFEGGSLHNHTCPACGKYWTHGVQHCEVNHHCECEACRVGSSSGEPSARPDSSDAGQTHAKPRAQLGVLGTTIHLVPANLLDDEGSGRCAMKQRDKGALTGRDSELSTAEVERLSAEFAEWVRRERIREAEAHRRAVATDPSLASDSQAWSDLAAEYLRLGQYFEAIEAYQRALAIDASKVQTWIDLGISYNHVKRYDKATEAFLRAVELEPRNAQAWFELGLDYREQGQQDKVIEVYRHLRPLDRYLAGCLLPWHVRLRRFVSKPEGKQLIVLSAAGMWVSALMLLELFSGIYRWSSALAALFFCSLPVLIFAGILFWWFGRDDRKRNARSDS